ncbi:MAG TPA: uroporphyrinogen-III C-methyltransferase [Gemmatimonadaceae bacterium]|nr:uroporphyrinogen-III C-methyltransferase [Gemmatimonadaceae bacterium]
MSSPAPSAGIVYLVGAGPGDPGLLTVRARELLDDCDAVVFDALVNPVILSGDALRPDAERHFVGKRGGGASTPQEEITALLVRLAREGKRVVRLKGGDPLVFGRGSEEAQALADAGIAFEIVPGITAGIAAPAYAGIPVTHRGLATSVTFVTGHEDPSREESGTDWSALARAGGTLVLYMGVKRLPEIVEALAAGGLSRETPAAMIEWGTHPRQRTVEATLGTLVDVARRERVQAPSITVIGEVVRLRGEIAWFDARPLHGARVVVTRARTQASELAATLRALGADVIEAPAIRIEPLDPAPLREALARTPAYDWLIVTSQNAVDAVWRALRASGRDARALATTKLAVVGPATAEALRAHGIEPDVVPSRFVAEGVVEALRARDDVLGARALFVRAEGARDLLPAELDAMGATVDEVVAYRTVSDPDGAAAAREALERGEVDVVTFTSGSTVRYFVDAVGAELVGRARVATMGPITSDTARSLGLRVDVEAREATIAALVEAVIALARAR